MVETEENPKVFPFSEALKIMGDSYASHYIFNYLRDIKPLSAETCILEPKYIDKDYLIDYSKFYSRSFDIDEKFTQRLHFFYNKFSEEDFDKIILNDSSKSNIEELNKYYLGFTIIKPIKDHKENKLIGRTALQPYPKKEGDEERFYLTAKQNVSLFGINLSLESVPFQTQDQAVAACATIACWVTLHPLSDLFEIAKLSPYEVTEKSVTYPIAGRNFPSSGLTLDQMKNYYNSVGLDTEYIVPETFRKIDLYTFKDDVVADVTKAYLNLGLPIIIHLGLKKKIVNKYRIRHYIFERLFKLRVTDEYDYHAAVITGYRHKNGKVTELYLHDDNIGPYCKTLPMGKFSKLKYELLPLSLGKYSDIVVLGLFIPLYPKIRFTFKEMYQGFLKHRRVIELYNELTKVEISLDLYLTDLNKYKHDLIGKNFSRKLEILYKPLPRFLWVIRYHFQGIRLIDVIYDATAVYNKTPQEVIVYQPLMSSSLRSQPVLP